ncbi:hypothetical protein [Gloeocapsa sp. PCC 73106]|uniref:hypothetical protein n=1 Tax=Gloeocapsa sp. PCC 73106 TaxID=102232 RepID=UPI0002AC18ED|nr:hypothetical protein [Gloeocapsa sp. PCC 73106]ELR96902.1 hypothetical protein GLO73106DRAFT_00007030 [Gloeocapsa sp. PCC 73106]
MQPTTDLQTQETFIYPQLPLAVYREIVAHLSQIEGLRVTTLSQQAPTFDYYESQIGGLLVEYSSDLDHCSLNLLRQILDYYKSTMNS